VNAVAAYVDALSTPALATLKRNLEEAQINVRARIADHRLDEARIAGGLRVEDQQSYRLTRLAGLPPDAGWLATLHEYERVLELVETTHRLVIARQQERGQPADRDVSFLMEIQDLRHMVEQELASGRVAPDRAVTYRRSLDKLEAVLGAKERGEINSHECWVRTHELMEAFMRYVADPDTTSL
jgi:hypothetical protein